MSKFQKTLGGEEVAVAEEEAEVKEPAEKKVAEEEVAKGEQVSEIDLSDYRPDNLPYGAEIVDEFDTHNYGDTQTYFVVIISKEDVTLRRMFDISQVMFDKAKNYVRGWGGDDTCSIIFVDTSNPDGAHYEHPYEDYARGPYTARKYGYLDDYYEVKNHVYGMFNLFGGEDDSYSYKLSHNRDVYPELDDGYNYDGEIYSKGKLLKSYEWTPPYPRETDSVAEP